MEKSRLKTVLKLTGYLKGLRLEMFFNLLNGVLYRISPIVISFIVSLMVGDVITGHYSSVMTKLYIAAGMICLRALTGYIDMIIAHDIAYKILHRLRFDIYTSLEKSIPMYKEGKSSGDILAAAAADVDVLEWFYAHTINIAVIMVVIALAVFAVIYKISIYVLPVVLVFSVLNILVPILFTKISKKTGRGLRQASANINAGLTDQIQGLREILSFSFEKGFAKKLGSDIAYFGRANIKDASRRSIEQGISTMLNLGSMLSVLMLSHILIGRGMLDLRWVPSVLILTTAVQAPISEFMAMANQFGQIFAAADRVIRAIEHQPEVEGLGTEELGPIRSIEFINVSLHYPGAAVPAIENISFVLKPYENTAISGVSGAGKTTIAHLLVRFLDPTGGEILINGRDIKSYSLKSLRERISLVSQRSYLFNTTALQNIHMADPLAEESAVRDAAAKARAMEFLSKLPDGENTAMGETGARVSGGERQRISIARALLKNGDLYIFDEAQSDVDSENEEKISDMVLDLKTAGKIILTIAHRNSVIKKADKIIYLVNGKVRQTGSYEELAQNPEFKKSIMERSGV